MLRIKNKLIILLFTLLIILGITSCGNKNNNEDVNNNIEEENFTEIESIDKDEKLFNDYLNLFGRIYYKNSSLALDHCGTGFDIEFTGTSLNLDVISAPVTTLLDIYLDGEEYKSLKVARNGNLNICNELDNTKHLVRIIKASSTAAGCILINKITTDGKITKPTKEYELNIEFVGDSITCGAGVLVNNTSNTSYANSDVCKAYSYVCASLLNSSFSMVATEGICAKVTNGVNMSSYDMYSTYSLNNRTKYSNNKKNDIIVINLGTNDAGYLMSHPEYKDVFYQDYYDLVSKIRSLNPDSHIICIYGHMWVNDIILNSIKKVVSDFNTNGDMKVSYFKVSSDSSGGGGHPGMAGAKRQGEELAKFIKENIIKK